MLHYLTKAEQKHSLFFCPLHQTTKARREIDLRVAFNDVLWERISDLKLNRLCLIYLSSQEYIVA